MKLIEKLAIVLGAGLALLLIWWTTPVLVKVVATVYLFGVAPGLLLLRAFLPTHDLPTQLVLSSGSSWALSTTSVLFTVLWGGPPVQSTVLVVGGMVNVIAFGVALWVDRLQRPPRPESQPAPRVFWLSLVGILALAALLRFYALGYAEFQDDELDVANVAVRVMRGETEALLSDRRGPAQTILTFIIALTTQSLQEEVLRTPAALASLLLIATVFLLAWRMFRWQVAVISTLLLSLEGFVLAYGRIVQMQSTLLAMMALAVLALYLAQPDQDRRGKLVYQALAALFFVFGLLAHYEMLLLIPVLGYLYLQRQGWRFWQTDRRGVLTMMGIVLLIGGSFYGPFLRNPAFADTFDYYNNDIVGRALTNNLHAFWLVSAFYNSPYYMVALWLGLLLAWSTHLAQASAKQWWTIGGIGLLAASGLLLGSMLVWPWAPTSYGLAACIALLLLILLTPRVVFEVRLVTVWLFVFFLPYSFFLRDVHIHYYAYSIPWALLSGVGFHALYRYRPAPAYRRSLAAGFALFLLVCGTYTWLVFIQSIPEYALTYPKASTGWFATIQPAVAEARHGEAFGFPHKSGWKTIAILYRKGVLRGAYETNELYLKAAWYTRRQLHAAPVPEGSPPPRYYFVATVPHRLQAAPWPPPLDPTAYQQTGVVTVQGQPRLEIYERNEFVQQQTVQTYANELYESQFDQVNQLAGIQQQAEFQADDQFFADVANYLETAAAPHDGLILFIPEQSAILSYYYHGDKPYYLPARTADPRLPWTVATAWSERADLYALYWAEPALDPQGHFETWLNTQLFRLQEQWFGNIRLVRYQAPATPITATIQTPLLMQLGDKIRFLGYNFTIVTAHEGEATIQLSLFWQAVQPIDQRYKVFIHLRDANNQLVSQNDSEPGGGRQPTDGWQVTDGAAREARVLDNYALPIPANLPAGQYRLAIGMYLPATGERLPVYDNQGQRQANDEILLEIPFQARS